MKEITIRAIILPAVCLPLENNSLSQLAVSLESFLAAASSFLFVFHEDGFDVPPHLLNWRLFSNHDNCVLLDIDRIGQFIETDGTPMKQPRYDVVFQSLLEKHDISKDHVISFGSLRQHLSLSDVSAIHFHLGTDNILDRKYRNVIPMSEQYSSGLANTLRYFTDKAFFDNAMTFQDVIEFLDNSISFYADSAAPRHAIEQHNALCRELYMAFPAEIAAIFATGYPHYLLESDSNSFPLATPMQLLDTVTVSEDATTPDSILAYLKTRQKSFEKKTLSEHAYVRHRNNRYTKGSLKRDLGVDVSRHKYDDYKYLKKNVPPPHVPESSCSLDRYYKHACFEITDDVWPCYHCGTLQFPDLFPDQVIFKDTNVNCLHCRQTVFMLRNVMNCCTDMDMVIVIRDEKQHAAGEIKQFLMESARYYLYDLDFYRTMKNINDGPVDGFVTYKADLVASFPQLLRKQWAEASFNAIALWSLTLDNRKFNIGEDFPLAFEPRVIADNDLLYAFLKARKDFAIAHRNEDVIDALRRHRQQKEQMLSNADIVKRMYSKLNSWRSIDVESLGSH